MIEQECNEPQHGSETNPAREVNPDDFIRAAVQFDTAIIRLIRAMGMQAENDQRKAVGSSMAYHEEDFIRLTDPEPPSQF